MRFFLGNMSLRCALVGLLLGCSPPDAPTIKSPSASQLSEFVRKAGISLPASAQPIGWREEHGMDEALWLQVRMPVQDFQRFLDNSPFHGSTLTSNDPYQISQFREFLPKPPAHYRAGQLSLPNGRVLNLVVDESDNENVVVYLMWHET
jgi:hypothetical protein